MHLFYRILCLIQFVQIRAAKSYNYGLDKEIVLQNRTESYIKTVFVRKELHLFIHSFTQQYFLSLYTFKYFYSACVTRLLFLALLSVVLSLRKP